MTTDAMPNPTNSAIGIPMISAANELVGARADRVRAVLWLAVDEEAAEAA